MLFTVTTEQPVLLVMPVPKIKSILSILLESSSGSFITPKLDNVLENDNISVTVEGSGLYEN